jgi:hypothetical protein
LCSFGAAPPAVVAVILGRMCFPMSGEVLGGKSRHVCLCLHGAVAELCMCEVLT